MLLLLLTLYVFVHYLQPHLTWLEILDMNFGVARHIICFSQTLMHNWRSIFYITVILLNIIVVFMWILSELYNFQNTWSLCDVLFIPQFQYNLISVSCLLHDGSFVLIQFSNIDCVIHNNSSLRMIGSCCNGCWIWVIFCPLQLVSSLILLFLFKCNIFHLGHLSFKTLSILKDTFTYFWFSWSFSSCDICPLAKHKCLIFHSNNKSLF